MADPDPPLYPIPKLTFGVELELDYAVLKVFYDEWLLTNPVIPRYAPLPPKGPTRKARLEPTPPQESPPASPPAPSEATASDIAHSEADSFETARSQIVASEKAASEQAPSESTNDASPTTSEHYSAATGSTHSALTTSSQDDEKRSGLLQYLLAYLNRQVPGCPSEPPLYGPVAWADPKSAPSDSWHLTYDNSLIPHRAEFAAWSNQDPGTVRETFKVMGAELVSSILYLDLPDTWVPQLEQLAGDLCYNGEQGVWFSMLEHLHVHFAIEGEELSLDIVKNVLVLYGIFEKEIESWLKPAQRNNPFCRTLRSGMEVDRIGRRADGQPFIIPARRYTPREFADGIWAANDLDGLRTEVTGYSRGEGLGLERLLDEEKHMQNRGWKTVGISMARENKPLTLEFRHHHGTVDPDVIKWWVQFCGGLVRYCHYLGQMGQRLHDVGPVNEEGYLEVLAKGSVLDLIGFPDEGKAHFERMAKLHRSKDFVFERVVLMEDAIIAHRIEGTKQGEQTGAAMDASFKSQQWYQDNFDQFGVDPLPDVVPDLPGSEMGIVRFLARSVSGKDWASMSDDELLSEWKYLSDWDPTGRVWLMTFIFDDLARQSLGASS